jgi:hypothetical protein
MAITPDHVIEETRNWPREQLEHLVDLLTIQLHSSPDPENEAAWKVETRRRVAELERDRASLIPGEDVARDIRKIVGR